MPAPTIRDVAQRARVSTATVSRVLNQSGTVDGETARAVMEAVAALGYRRNVHWERLSRRSSQTLCFVLGNRSAPNSMHVRLLMACERACRAAGYDLVFLPLQYRADTRQDRLVLPRLLADQGMVDGVILVGLHHQNLRDALTRLGLPHVLLGNTYIGPSGPLKHDALVYDDVLAVREATDYLLRLGHQRIAFVGNTELPWFARRYKGYQRAMRSAGQPVVSLTERWDLDNVEYGRRAGLELLRDGLPATAVMAGNDEVAAGVWKAMVAHGVALPRQLSLVGFGDREEASILEPSLTTISIFPDAIGGELAQMLLEKLRDPAQPLPARTLPCQLVERASCAPPSTAAAGARPSTAGVLRAVTP